MTCLSTEMGELSIRIKIGNREYPMKVSAQEEAQVRQAGKQLNERLRSYKEQFGIDDHQDLLAMVSFDLLIEKIKADEALVGIDQLTLEKISHLNHQISQVL